MANANFFSPDGGITRYPLEDTEGRIMFEDDIDGINRVKIFHPSQTINGITFTVSNGKIIASGTATDTAIFWCSLIDDHYTIPAGNYHASGCPEQPSGSTQYHIGYLCTRNGSDNVYGNETGNGLDFEVLDGDVDLRVGIAIYSGYAIQGTLVFEPMITEAKYAGIPYRPYNQQSIQNQLNAQTGVLGAKNLLENKATSQTINGVTFTVNADGSVTANGTATAQCWFPVKDYLLNPLHLDAGSYFVNGCSGGSSSTHFIRVTNGAPALATSYNGETAFNLSSSSDSIGVYIVIGSNQTASNLVFKPMIRLASDPDDTYVPYAMTNRELTERLTNITNTTISQAFTDETIYENTGRTGGDSKYVIKNGICFLHLYVTAKNPVTTDTYVGIDLPIPQTTGVFIFGQLVSSSGDSLMVGVRNRSSNNLMLTGGVANRKYYGTIIYPVDL